MTGEKKKEIWRVVKFVLFSASAGIIQIGLFTLLNELCKWSYWPCYLIALVASVVWNFTLNRKFTFQSANNVPKAMAMVLGYYAVFTPLSTILGNWLLSVTANKYVFLFAVNIIILILGCLVDTSVIQLVMIPILWPVAEAMGINIIHFGLIICFNMMVGLSTPPFGMCLFITSGISGTPLKDIIREIWWPIIVMLIVLAVITYIPDVVLFLPKLTGMMA